MTTMMDVQFQDYVRGVRSSGSGASVLAERLKKEAPQGMRPDEKAALAFVLDCAEVVRRVLADRDRLSPGKLRPVLTPYANDWSGLYEALTAKTRISPHISDVGPRATAVVTSLFPDGVSFLLLPARAAWSEGWRRLERMDTEKLKKEIDDLVGPEFLTCVETSTAALADAIGTGESASKGSSSAALQEALGTFGRSVGAYGRVLAAHCDESDAASVKRFLDAVAPMDEHRAIMRASGGGNDADVPDEPEVVASAPVSAPAHTSPGSTPSPVATPTQSSVGNTPAPTPTSAGNTPSPVVAPDSSTNGVPNAA
jgi:hypothetical protein